MLALLLSISFVALPASFAPGCAKAYAADSSSSTSSDDDKSKDDEKDVVKDKDDEKDKDDSDEDETDKPKLTIADIAIYINANGNESGIKYASGYNHNTSLAEASNPSDKVRITVTAKNQQLQLRSMATWSNFTDEPGSNYVEWSSSNTSIATVSTTGLVMPKSDGEVGIKCTVKSQYAGGKTVSACLHIAIKGQSSSPYISDIRLIDADGKEVGKDTIVLDETVGKPAAFIRLGALVDTIDPATGKKETYKTGTKTLSSLTSDFADLEWRVNVPDVGYVDNTGLYRPKDYGTVIVEVKSLSGKAGKVVSASVAIQTIDPEGSLLPDYHPQDSLTVKAYYETLPPDDRNDPNDKHYAVNKTYSLSELKSLGVQTATYTSLSSNSYYTINASGIPVASVLRDSGINLDGIATLEFGTFDGYSQPLSYSFLYQPRYYYPNIGNANNKYFAAEQVYPIFAFQASRVRNGATEKNYSDMNEATRFEMIFGATPAGGTSQYQIKWVHTVYVVLKGAPPVEDGMEEVAEPSTDTDKKSSVGSNGSGAGEDNGNGNGAGPGNNGAGTDGSGGAGLADAESKGGEGSPGDVGGSGDNSKAASQKNSGAFSLYQIMNNKPSDVELDLTFDNPYKRFVAPVTLLVLVIGALQAAWWYRRQSRATPWVPPPKLAVGA